MIRTTEQSAPATLAELIPQLTKLTTEQPTTAELEEALTRIVPAITRALADWLRSRHEIGRNAHITAVMDQPMGSGQIPATPVLTALAKAFTANVDPRVRLQELEDRVSAERDQLSDFRKDEAFYLALTDAEQAELVELRAQVDNYYPEIPEEEARRIDAAHPIVLARLA